MIRALAVVLSILSCPAVAQQDFLTDESLSPSRCRC